MKKIMELGVYFFTYYVAKKTVVMGEKNHAKKDAIDGLISRANYMFIFPNSIPVLYHSTRCAHIL